MKNKKHSPLKDKPLRYAGQSLDEQIDDLRDKALFYFFYPGFLILYIALQWINRTFPPTKPSTAIVSYINDFLFWGGIAFCVFKIFQIYRKIKILAMARDGEKIVAENLQELIKQNATILHDVISNEFNIDHVVISSHGIFLIETKTYSKPIKKDALISFDEENIYVDGKAVERKPIRQAKALAKWLQELIKKSTGQKLFIQPVVLFPGWYTEKIKKGQEVWILNPKALPTFIENEPIRLKDSEVHLVTFHLSRYIRTFEPKRK